MPAPRIGPGGRRTSRPVSTKTRVRSPIASGSKTASIQKRRNCASQTRRGLGPGLGYVARLRRLAPRFRRAGVRIVAALKNIHSARCLDGLDIEIVQAPLWPVTFMTDAECARLSTATFADALAGFGLADEQTLRVLLSAWDRLFSLAKPDLVIAEHAPAATLAARGRLPLALVGTCFTLPPA